MITSDALFLYVDSNTLLHTVDKVVHNVGSNTHALLVYTHSNTLRTIFMCVFSHPAIYTVEQLVRDAWAAAHELATEDAAAAITVCAGCVCHSVVGAWRVCVEGMYGWWACVRVCVCVCCVCVCVCVCVRLCVCIHA